MVGPLIAPRRTVAMMGFFIFFVLGSVLGKLVIDDISNHNQKAHSKRQFQLGGVFGGGMEEASFLKSWKP